MATKKQRIEAIKRVITEHGGTEATAMEVYSDVFKLGEGVLERSDQQDNKAYKTNPIGYGYNLKVSVGADGKKVYEKDKGKHIILYEDTFEKGLKELQKYDFAIISGLSYFGWRNYLRNANKMHVLIMDLDGISENGMKNFLGGGDWGLYPKPNYIVLSGTNCHLYYVFEEAVPLYPDIKLALKELKHELVGWCWNQYTSDEPTQYQGINQGFRVIGGKTKRLSPIRRVTAYRLNEHPWDLKGLNEFVPKDKQINDVRLFRSDKISMAEARAKYPRWAEWIDKKRKGFPGRLVDLSKQKGHRGDELYCWWLEKIKQEAVYGSRYFAVMCLVIYAVKCNVPYERVKADAYSLIPIMTIKNNEKPFTAEDVECALECYDENYATFPRKDIEHISHIAIPTNKRNGRKQAEHLRRARAVRDVDYPDGGWRNKDGRPKGSGEKKNLVADFIAKNPTASVSEIAKALGVSRTTVYKWKESEVKRNDERRGSKVV